MQSDVIMYRTCLSDDLLENEMNQMDSGTQKKHNFAAAGDKGEHLINIHGRAQCKATMAASS